MSKTRSGVGRESVRPDATSVSSARVGVLPRTGSLTWAVLADGRVEARAGDAEPAVADFLSTAIAVALTNLARVSPPRDAQAKSTDEVGS